VSKPPRTLTQENRQQRHRLRRDRPTIKIRSQALKDNPALREYNERHEKTVGELLVEKFLIKDKQLEDGEQKTKLYHQASLMSNDVSKESPPLDEECENDILKAMRRRVTRRMTRRRSSADVIPLDPAQLEREAALHAAQAVALDTLVAAEQAELEVEARKGTFIKRPVMRLPAEISEESENGEEEEPDEEAGGRVDSLGKEAATRKKRSKSPSRAVDDHDDDDNDNDHDNDNDNDHDNDDNDNDDNNDNDNDDDDDNDDNDDNDFKTTAQEFEWDDREKCDDIRLIVPAVNELNDEPKDNKSAEKIEDAHKRIVSLKAKRKDDEARETDTGANKVDAIKAKAVNKERENVGFEKRAIPGRRAIKLDDRGSDRGDKSKDKAAAKKEEKGRGISSGSSKRDKRALKEEQELRNEDLKEKLATTKLQRSIKRAVSVPQEQVDKSDDARPAYKVEASNSVGDFSTLFVKSSNCPSSLSARTIEQFRESIRLPAPRKFGAMGISNIETKVVLPVRRPYVRDTSRNSVYLALKPSQNIGQVGLGANDSSSINIDEIRKESGSLGALSIDRRPAKSPVTPENRSKIDSDSLLSEGTDVSTLVPHTVLRSSNHRQHASDDKPDDKALPIHRVVNKRRSSDKEEFVSWWDDIDETTKTDLELRSADDTADNAVAKSINELLTGRNRDAHSADRAESVEVLALDKSHQSASNDKSLNKVADRRDKVKKTVLDEQGPTNEKFKPSGAHKGEQVLPKGSSNCESDTSIKEVDKVSTKRTSGEKAEVTLSPITIEESSQDKAMNNNDMVKIKYESLRKEHRLPNIPEEPKSTSPTEKRESDLFTIPSETKCNKALHANEKPSFSVVLKKADQSSSKASKLSAESAAAKNEKDERKKKVDAKAIMQIEKKILEDAESPRKIVTSAIPETQLIEASSITLPTEKDKKLESTTPKKKVGLLPTKKKSSETAATHATEIDFWSEIKAQESVKVSETRRKAQLRVDSPTEDSESFGKAGRNLKLDLSRNLQGEVGEQRGLKGQEEQEEEKTPLIADEEDLKTPLIVEEKKAGKAGKEEEEEEEELKTPLIADEEARIPTLLENKSEVARIDQQQADDNSGAFVLDCDVIIEVDETSGNKEQLREDETLAHVDDDPAAVKKISKWIKHDNLSNLKEAEGAATPVVSKEASPQVSLTSSTTTKKKVTKRKKSSTAGKKKTEKTESTKTGTKTKVTIKKTAASPQTSLLKTPMSVSGSPRNTPSQRPTDLKKLFYTTPAILLTATPRDLRKVRRAKAKKKNPTTRTLSLSSDSTGSTRSTATTSTEDSSNCDEDIERRRLASTRSNDSGFDGSPRLSSTGLFWSIFFFSFFIPSAFHFTLFPFVPFFFTNANKAGGRLSLLRLLSCELSKKRLTKPISWLENIYSHLLSGPMNY
jgi:hypothetical protein